MELILPTFERIATLLLFMGVGYILEKCRLLPDNTATALSKCENYLFIPALVLGTFIKNFTAEKVTALWQLLLFSSVVEVIMCFIAVFTSKLITKDKFKRNVFTYGLAFSNFGFFGNALFAAVFPDYFVYYIIFTLPMWAIIYIWAVPYLLMEDKGGKGGIKNLINPMFIAMVVGAVVGISGISVPSFITETVSGFGDCMSPIAMLLTGITLGKAKLRPLLCDVSVYIVSAIRLLLFPIGISLAVKYIFLNHTALPEYFYICLAVSLAMPLGLNTVVVPSAYGRDVTVPTGMALISHVLGAATIPLVFLILGIG